MTCLVVDGDQAVHLAVVEPDLDHLLAPRRIVPEEMIGDVLSTLCGRWRNLIPRDQSRRSYYSEWYLQYPGASEPHHVKEPRADDPRRPISAYVVTTTEVTCPQCLDALLGLGTETA